MPNVNVQVTVEKATETVSCDNHTESRQLNYYYRKTTNKEKRKYVPYSKQENPLWHLKRYHTRKNALEKTLETAADLSNTTCDADADDGHGYADIWPDDNGCIDDLTSKSE